jgi:cephalosporin hydroxylase
LYQEIISELRPALVVETGTYMGGSALFMATVMDALDSGRVVSIDKQHVRPLPTHPRVEYVLGSSVAPEVVEQVRAAAARAGGPVMAVLDSDHSRDHVLGELEVYADIVTPDSYLIVEDTNINGHPVLRSFGPGPMEAVETFLAGRHDFSVDADRERLLLTMNPHGYLRRSPAPR